MAENPTTPKVSIRNDGRIVVQNQVAASLPSAASIAMVGNATATKPPFNIRPGERYTDADGKMWELTDHGQWKEVRDGK
jgi:hypothetical protein